MATGSGKAPRPVPRQVLPHHIEEETDHLLGAPRKGASDRETWGLRGKGGIVTDTFLGVPRKGATVKETWELGRREAL